jgi:putative ABC transport system permease protein
MRDVRQWLREFRRSPANHIFMLVSWSLSLAGGLVALSLASGILWRALPFYEPDGLAKLELRDDVGEPRWWSWPEFESIALNPRPPLLQLAAYTSADYNAFSEPGRPPEALIGTLVSDAFFRVLGIGVSLGRLPDPSDHRPGGPLVVILGHELWERRYGSDPSIVGRTIRLSAPSYLAESNQDYRVIGVLDRDAWLFSKQTDLVLPLRSSAEALADPRRKLIEHVVARLDPHATLEAVRREDEALLAHVRAAGGEPDAAAVVVDALRSALLRELRPQLLLVLAIAMLVFLLAAGNVVIGLSSRALDRRAQTVIRLAIGASPAQVAMEASRQLAITTLVAVLGSLLLATWFVDIAVAQVPAQWWSRVPSGAAAAQIDLSVLTTLALVIAGILLASGTWLYRWTRSLNVHKVLSTVQGNETPKAQRWRSLLVGGEVALCAAVVMVAITLLGQLWQLRRVDLGVRTDRTIAIWVNATASTYADPETRADYFQRVADQLSSMPGIEQVGAIDLPFRYDWEPTMVRAGADKSGRSLSALDRAASVGYRDVSGLSLQDGRWFESADRPGAPLVTVVSRSLAEALWPNTRAVGQLLQLGTSEKNTLATVVGVVSDIRQAPHRPPSRVVYRPVPQATPSWLYYLVRSAGEPDIDALSTAVWRVDPDQPIDGPWSLAAWVDDQTGHVRFLATLTAMLAGIAIVLAAAGLHGLTEHWVYASQRELGIRRAVGATDRSVVAWFAWRWLRVVGPAVLAGCGVQIGLLLTASANIEGVTPASIPQSFAGATAILLYAAGVATAALRLALRADTQQLIR